MDIPIRHVKIVSIDYYPTTRLNNTIKSKVRLQGYRRNYWALDKLEEFEVCDTVDLTYQMVLINNQIHYWISNISKL